MRKCGLRTGRTTGEGELEAAFSWGKDNMRHEDVRSEENRKNGEYENNINFINQFRKHNIFTA